MAREGIVPTGTRTGVPSLPALWWLYRARGVLRRLWLLQETRPILVGNTLCLAVNLAELFFALARPCVMSSELYAEACGNSMLILQVVATVKVVLMIGLVNHVCNPRLLAAYCWQLGLKPPPGELSMARLRGWAAASSKEVFEEVVRVNTTLAVFLTLVLPPTDIYGDCTRNFRCIKSLIDCRWWRRRHYCATKLYSFHW